MLHSGVAVDLWDPEVAIADVRLHDVAWGLAHITRWSGALNVCVATHTIALSRVVPPKYALRALHHDDGEALLNDVARPLKALDGMAWYRELEELWQVLFYRKFGVSAYRTRDPAVLHSLDTRLAVFEAELLGGPTFYTSLMAKLPHLRHEQLSSAQRRVVAPLLLARANSKLPPPRVMAMWKARHAQLLRDTGRCK
jgi:hypothetical protein